MPMLATMLARWVPRYDRTKDKIALNAVLMICVIVCIIHYFPTRGELQNDLAKGNFPSLLSNICSDIRAPGPMFNNYGFGAYLRYGREGPENKVFIDGRGDLYERGGVFSDYLHIVHSWVGRAGCTRSLRYKIRSCLISRDSPLSTALSVSPLWQRIYSDNLSALFIRTDAHLASQ